MNKSTSLYLDLVRFAAALVVFISHFAKEQFSGLIQPIQFFRHLDHDAVVVFFVLSGFVIAYVANEKEKNIRDFSISRFARLYSVVIPALLLTVVFDYFGSRIEPSYYISEIDNSSQPALRFIASLLFLNELWFLDVRPFSNAPFWSIGYEFWYYVLFAAFFYLKKYRLTVFLLICLIVGPVILILFPVWLMGYFTYLFASRKKVPEFIGFLLFIGSLVAFFIWKKLGIWGEVNQFTESMMNEITNGNFKSLFEWSNKFISDYFVGLLISLNFIGFIAISERVGAILAFFQRPIRYLASFTFILYLVHYPLLHFFAALTYDSVKQSTQPYLLLVLTLVSVWVIGQFTEKKKHFYKNLFYSTWMRLSR